MVAVERDHDGAAGVPGKAAYRGDDVGRDRATDQERDARMRDVVQTFDVDGDNAAMTKQVEEVCEEESRPAAIRAGLDEQRGFHLGDRFLHYPQVEDVLPDRPAE